MGDVWRFNHCFVKEVKKPKTIVIQWGEPRTTVEFIFEERLDGFTYVTIKNYGFQLEPEELIETIKGNTGGFTTVLDGLKAYLEFGIRLKLVEDKFPQHLRDDWSKYTSED